MRTLLIILSFRKGQIGSILLLSTIAFALFAPFIAPYDPLALGRDIGAPSLGAPSFQHPMGTDILGRDVFSRLIFGARISLAVGTLAVLVSLLIGCLVGVFAGYYGGITDSILMRITDVFLSFPLIIGALLILVITGPGLVSLVAVIGLFGWTTIARLMRSKVLSVKELDFIDSARMAGATDGWIIIKHILPHSLGPVLVVSSLAIGQIILVEAALSFFGLGVAPPTPDWGYMVFEGRKQMMNAPWLVLFPGLAIMLTVLAFVFISDALSGIISREHGRGE